jgi:tRNA nucleotidyltransferase (CCA-adding enzyme)
MRLKKYLHEDFDWKKYTNSNPMLRAAKKVLDKIASKGYRAYIVGGVVRDLILGEEPHDIDICGNMPLDEVRKLFRTYSLSGDEFGIIGIIIDSQKFEYALFRGETYQKIKGVRKILN